jgi:hypothetical protein
MCATLSPVKKEPTAVFAAVIANFSSAINYCYKEDVQVPVLLPLETFGRLLMVDPDRLRQGEPALNSMPTPKSWDWKSISIKIGLETPDPRGSPAQSVTTAIR